MITYKSMYLSLPVCNLAVQIGNGVTLPLPADVYVGLGYTEKSEPRILTQEEWDRLNNMNFGGF